MAVISLIRQLVARELDLLGVNHDDIVTAIHMRRITGFVLAPETRGDDRRETSEYDAFGIDQKPFLINVLKFRGIGFHGLENPYMYDVAHPTAPENAAV